MNTPVNFKLAKLLKEKGFIETCKKVYRSDGLLYTPMMSGSKLMHSNILEDESVSAPTIAEVIMWLYEKHGIWIRVTPIPYSDNLTHWRWEHMSTIYATRNCGWKKVKDYMLPTQAYEAAVEYTLNNLI